MSKTNCTLKETVLRLHCKYHYSWLSMKNNYTKYSDWAEGLGELTPNEVRGMLRTQQSLLDSAPDSLRFLDMTEGQIRELDSYERYASAESDARIFFGENGTRNEMRQLTTKIYAYLAPLDRQRRMSGLSKLR